METWNNLLDKFDLLLTKIKLGSTVKIAGREIPPMLVGFALIVSCSLHLEPSISGAKSGCFTRSSMRVTLTLTREGIGVIGFKSLSPPVERES